MPVAVALLLTCSVAWPSSAHASAYRYWTYWQGTTTGWAFATAGPASLVPADGSVEGWRFAVTTQAGRAGDAPSATASFADVCGSTPAQAERKRVALVVDSGTPDAAPDGQAPPAVLVTCVVAPAEATGYQVLRAAAEVRTEGGLVCGIAGYPTGECAPVVDEADLASGSSSPDTASSTTASSTTAPPTGAPSPTASSPASAAMPAADDAASGAGTPWLTLVVLLVVATVGLLLWRRRRAQ